MISLTISNSSGANASSGLGEPHQIYDSGVGEVERSRTQGSHVIWRDYLKRRGIWPVNINMKFLLTLGMHRREGENFTEALVWVPM